MKSQIRKQEWIIVGILAITMWLIPYFLLGFRKYGLDVPYMYAGGDDFTAIVGTKSIGETGWYWSDEKIGAPYGLERYDFTASFATNFESIVAKVIYCFTQDAITTLNLQFLLVFPFCAIAAYFVLRALKINSWCATFGASLFGMAPYIYERNITHLSLSVCYFVPLSILLCVWAFEEDSSFLKWKNFFRNKKNIVVVMLALLIANNGIAYYAFFSCFFLGVVTLYKLVVRRKFEVIIVPAKMVCMITLFLGLALLPVFVYQAQNGVSAITTRGIGEIEQYGLKIAQMFIPLNGHGIPWLENIISEYNENMPFINENKSAYLGLGGIIGFVASILTLFLPSAVRINQNGEKLEVFELENNRLLLFSRMIIFAILLTTVGGFSSILGVLGLQALRGYNRISIFIMFLCICVLCIYIQKIFRWINEKGTKYLKKLAIGLGVFGALVCIMEQLPQGQNNDEMRELYKSLYESDKDFVAAIEQNLQAGDGVYQLPYHKYPEAGPVNRMNDYQLFAGYIHSNDLKWSYGAMKEREADQWHEYVSELPMEEVIDIIIASGFRGIYIDSRAYSDIELSELCAEIEAVIQQESIISNNKCLYFYNLYPYIEKNIGKIDWTPLTLEDIKYPKYELGKDIFFYSDEYNASKYVKAGVADKESGFSWTNADEVEINFKLEETINTNLLHAVFELENVFNSQQTVIVEVNDIVVFENVVLAGENIEFDFNCPENKIVEMRIALPDAMSPYEMGMSGDCRELGIAIKKLFVVDKFNPVRQKEYSKYVLNNWMWFYTEEYNVDEYVEIGLADKESGFSWTNANEMTMAFEIEETEQNNLKAVFELASVFNKRQRVIIYLNEAVVYNEVVTGGNIEFDFNNPLDGIVNIRMELPDAVSPLELGQSQDARELALALKTFRITPVD